MPRYYMNDGAFELPDLPFTDRTIHYLESKLPGGGDVGLVVRRAPMPVGKSLRELVEGLIKDEARELMGFSVLANEDATWADEPAIEVSSRWRSDGKVVYQRKAHVVLNDTWVYFALTAPFEARASCDAWLAEVRASLRLRESE